MIRNAPSLPLFIAGLLTLGSDPARFQTEPPACYRASWQLPGPDFHRQATTSLRTARSAATSQRHLPLCWAHERTGLRTPAARAAAHGLSLKGLNHIQRAHLSGFASFEADIGVPAKAPAARAGAQMSSSGVGLCPRNFASN